MKISRTVFQLQSGYDFVTDRQTDGRTDDQGKNNMSPNPTGGDIIIFTPAEDRTRDPLHAHPKLYRAAIKAGLCGKGSTSVIHLTLLHIPASIVGTYRLLLPVHFKSVRFGFPVTVRSFRDGSPVYS